MTAPFFKTYFHVLVSVTTVITEAITAVDRLGSIRLEWHPGYLTTVIAGCLIHLPILPVALSTSEPSLFTTTAVLTGSPAGGTPGRLVGKAFLGKKLLFTRCEFKFTATILA